METGQTFTIDQSALDEMASFYKVDVKTFAGKVEVGQTYSIAKSRTDKSVTSSEVRASKWSDGKPSRGRPRKFPRATVARLLGENDDPSLTGETIEEEAPAEPVAATTEPSDEQLEEQAEVAVAAAVASSDSSDSSEDEAW